MSTLRYIFGFFLLTFTFVSCLPAPYYQKEEAIPQGEWNYNFKPQFTFEITDTVVQYEPTFIIQHTQAYPYSNIWMWMYVKMPGEKTARKERVNVVLAEPTGKWLGRGMGEIYEQRMKIKFSDSISFNHKGTYHVTMEQNMRVNPLPDVLHVGLRIEKTGMKAQ